MNKFFKITVIAAVTFTAAGVFAAPPKHHNGNNGVRLAADIVRLVDNSIRLITGQPQTVYVAPAPVVVTPPPPPPVIVPQPPIAVVQPPPPPVVVQQRPIIVKPQPKAVHRPVPRHHNNKPHRR